MTTKGLIEDVLEEYSRRKENGESHYQIKDFYSFFYINKYFSEKEKDFFCKECIFKVLEYFDKKRRSVVENREVVNQKDLDELTKKNYPYHALFQFCAPYAAQNMNEDEIISFLEYYDSSHNIKIFNEHRQDYHDVDVSNHLLNLFHVLDLIVYFLKHNPSSERVKDRLKQLKNGPLLQKREYVSEKIDDIIAGNGKFTFINSEKQENKELSAHDLAVEKKWKWLQENEMRFINQRGGFYTIVEDLSKINYFNKHGIDSHLNALIALINPKEYEIFILDIYNEIKNEGNKRSTWFIGDKVIALQIFVWLMHYLDTPNQFSILSKLAEKCFTKLPKIGPTSRKLGDVVLKVLDESETIEGLGILLNLKARAKYPVFREALDASIKRAINYTKLDPNEVEDYFISDFGLINGEVAHDFGDFSSKIEIEHFNKVNLTWFKKDGSIQKSTPANVKSENSSELKLWKAKQNDILKELIGQKQRIENYWRKKKKWSYTNWERYILNHELIRYISRKLIWQFDKDGKTITAIWDAGNLIDSSGGKLTGMEGFSVTLWHPGKSTVAEVQSWRRLILSREIQQPFKQAFREIYLVTDAEIMTSTYSNRFLNHVVRHHKFAALANQRTWVYANVFAQHYPYIEYPDYQIRATFDLDSSYELATTGRVHFRDVKKNEALLMESVPVQIFSETMRDIDLFVGVCSIGIEETWNQNQHMNYWKDYSTADLSETAKTRRSVLANMLPKLKIKDQCELTEKYLKVKGKIRTYKIHLGSGNILMEPNDQYLCIVPDSSKRGQADRVFLPFNDDAVFSIILSKAFLLSDDDKIEDEEILNQINT